MLALLSQGWENQQIYSMHVWLSFLRTWLHVYILLYCNTAVRGLAIALLYMTPEDTRGKADVSAESCGYRWYNIYVTLSTVMYSIARKYPRILMLQAKYFMARSYHIGLTSQKLRKRRDSWNINDNAIKLTGFGICWKPWIWFHACWLIDRL